MVDSTRAEASLEKVTDYVEEKEIDSEKSKRAMSLIGSTIDRKTYDAEQLRDKEFSKISIRQEDVDLIIDELGVTREVAIHTLRANNADLGLALSELVRS